MKNETLLKVDKKFTNLKKYKGNRKKRILDAASAGELRTFIKHPTTGCAIRVHPDLVKRIRQRIAVTLEEIIDKKWD